MSIRWLRDVYLHPLLLYPSYSCKVMKVLKSVKGLVGKPGFFFYVKREVLGQSSPCIFHLHGKRKVKGNMQVMFLKVCETFPQFLL